MQMPWPPKRSGAGSGCPDADNYFKGESAPGSPHSHHLNSWSVRAGPLPGESLARKGLLFGPDFPTFGAATWWSQAGS